MEDLRASRMPSAEGRGLARAAWDKYVATIEPAVQPLARRIAIGVIEDCVGFWVLWHAYGGFEGLRELGMPRTTIFRKVKLFRRIFGEHPDEFVFPGLTVEAGAVSEAVIEVPPL